MNALKIEPISAFSDNYIWMCHNGRHAVVVDPGQAEPVLARLDAIGLRLCAILVTHLHYDHSFGVPGLLARWNVPVYGPYLNEFDRLSHPPFPAAGTVPLACITEVVGEGDRVRIEELNWTLSVMAVPGHTRGHLVYVDRERDWLFSGDTLFGGGCGKVFGGSMHAMADSLKRLAALPDRTEVYCAHEYTLANLRFAQAVEPNNQALALRIAADTAKRAARLPTLPSTIAMEKASNPFLRTMAPEVLDALQAQRGVHADNEHASFEALRKWKDGFK